MNKIDTSKWGKFIVGELFDCETTKGIASKNDLVEGNIPYVTRSAENNGKSGYCGNADRIVKGNCITIGAEGFTAFYQENDFVAGNKVYALRHRNLNNVNALYICTVLNKLSCLYSFNNARILDKIKQEVISLPIDNNGEPDWQYMENYMKEITKLAVKRVEKLKEEKIKYKIDTKGWGKFRVGDLFTVYLGDYNNPKFLTEDENGIPLVSATAINNGISGYYKKTSDLKVITKNKITWGKQCPYFYYQTTDFITGQGTYYLDVSTLSFYTNLFVCAVLNNEISQKYDYNNCLIGKKLSEEIILLPITTKGSPDWQFMEDYMKNIMEQAEKKFSNIPQ